MSSKYKVILSFSLALAIFYTLPWIALHEQSRASDGIFSDGAVVATRVTYLFLSVFATSVLFFQYNFFWKHRLRATKSRAVHRLLNLFYNGVILFVTCAALVIISQRVLNINAWRGFLIFYVYRNAGIGLMVMLITYVLELVHKSEKDRIEILTLQNQNTETALAALRAQIDPHFLFNCLTSLSGLIRSNSKDALTFVDHLAETFRYILDKREYKMVTVRDELHFLESYIFMMKQRFDQGFQVTINLVDADLVKHIPQFAMQITVENALTHNVVSNKNPLILEIVSSDNAIVIRNNCRPKQRMAGHGIGLANLSKRYQLIGGNQIAITKNEHTFEIKLPLL
jgi:two-component system LytT family sensor kinase